MAHPSAPADWPAAASPLVAEALQAPPRPARVLAAFPTALYLQLDRHELVLPVLAEDALRLPTGLRLALAAREIAWGVEPGSHVLRRRGSRAPPAPRRRGGPRLAACPGHGRSPAPGCRRPWPARSEPCDTATEGAVLRELTADLARAALATPVPAGQAGPPHGRPRRRRPRPHPERRRRPVRGPARPARGWRPCPGARGRQRRRDAVAGRHHQPVRLPAARRRRGLRGPRGRQPWRTRCPGGDEAGIDELLPARPGDRAQLRCRPARRPRRRPRRPDPDAPTTPNRKEPAVTDHVELRRGAYYDSVSLMQVSRARSRARRASQAAQVAMATELNLDVHRAAWASTCPTSAGTQRPGRRHPRRRRRGRHAGPARSPRRGAGRPAVGRRRQAARVRRGAAARTLGAAAARSDANLALISVPGQHAVDRGLRRHRPRV